MLAIGLGCLLAASPLPAQRAVPTTVPTGPRTVPTVPVTTDPGSLSGSLPLSTLPTPDLDTAWPAQGQAGVQIEAGVGGDAAGAVVDRGAEDEARAYEYLERQAERADLIGGTPVLGKMRRLRR